MQNKTITVWGITWRVLIGVITPILFLFAYNHATKVEREYVRDGKIKICTVEKIIEMGNKQNVTVSYENDQGKKVTAKAILNRKVSVGEKAEAYVLDSKPGEVYYPPSTFLRIILFVIIGLLCLLMWAPLALAIYQIRQTKMEEMARQLHEMNSRY
ncbi:MAG: hypothetical protein J5845_04150 [Lachnospiraceae bacterium]|nr:hypothetical protein [Lachnospiraceae bacterium]